MYQDSNKCIRSREQTSIPRGGCGLAIPPRPTHPPFSRCILLFKPSSTIAFLPAWSRIKYPKGISSENIYAGRFSRTRPNYPEMWTTPRTLCTRCIWECTRTICDSLLVIWKRARIVTHWYRVIIEFLFIFFTLFHVRIYFLWILS